MKLTIQEIHRISETTNMIPTDIASILEVGCGDGRISNIINKKYNVTSIDINQTKIQEVSAKKIIADISNLPIKNDTYDLVISAEVIEHLDDDTFDKALKEMVRVCKKYILISVPFKENIPAQWKKCSGCGHIFHQWGHVRKFDCNALETLFNGAHLDKKVYLSPKETRIPPFFYVCARIIGGVWGSKEEVPRLCPECGSPAVKNEGNIIGKFFTRFIWKMDKMRIAEKPIWICGLYKKMCL